MSALSDICYARSGDLFIAYRTAGAGPPDLLLAPGYLTHVEQNFEWPPYQAFVEALASFGRVIVFDRRGSGMSDRLRDDGNFDEVIEDITAVLDAVGSERAALVGVNDGGPICSVFAAVRPERTSALILEAAYARGTAGDGYPWALSPEEHAATLRGYETAFGRRAFAARAIAPSLARDPAWLRWLLRAQRYGASPGAAMRWHRMTMDIDIREVLPTIRVPTLVLCRTGGAPRARGAAEHLATSIPDARLVEIPGDEPLGTGVHWRGDAAQVEQFVTGARTTLTADRILATVLFTDIVGSTGQALSHGDERWREVLSSHNATVRRLLREHSGQEVKTTGDGFLARFDRPGAAIRCAVAIREALAEEGIRIRAGLHAGEVEVLDDDIGGIAVHIASRIMGVAHPGEVLVSRTVRDLVAGSALAFTDAGSHSLKDLPEPWALYAVGG